MTTEPREQTVFLVDDDQAVLRSLSALVRVVFPNVETFASAQLFLEQFDPDRPGCLVLDVAMPGMNGLELQRRLRELGSELPIIFITGHGNVRMAVSAMQAGAVNFLEKPFVEHELWESIRKAIEVDRQRRLQASRRADATARLAQLTAGEHAVLELIIQGKLNKEIASALNLSVRAVEDRRARLMKKMRVETVAELVQLAIAK